MTIPSYDQFIFPLLKVLYPHATGLSIQKAYETLADVAGLSKQDRKLLLPSGQQALYKNRIGWAQDRLKKNGFSSSPSRGLWCLTSSGRAFFEAHKSGIDKKILKSLLSVVKSSEEVEATGPLGASEASLQTPVERIDAASQELKESVASTLLERIEQVTPLKFEKLVLDVLVAMGYGAERGNATHVGGSGDGGIDGIISLDRLGLEKVYIQAKRWKDKVGRPEIQAFYGALAGRRASKGVFITTASFSKEAETYAEQVGIILVHGHKLAALMVEFGVGVSQRIVKLPQVDNDYFEEES